MIPLLETMGFLLSTNTESLSLSNFCAALLARMLLDALSTSCRARSIVPEGLRWSSQELIKKKKEHVMNVDGPKRDFLLACPG